MSAQLPERAEQLARKLEDAGLELDDAREWVREVVGHELCDAERGTAVDEAWHKGYERGHEIGVDTQAKADERALQLARERLAAVIELVPYYEHGHSVGLNKLQRRAIAGRLRTALALGDVPIDCDDATCTHNVRTTP